MRVLAFTKRSATSNTGDKNSFAYSTARDRWPKVISSAQKNVEAAVRTHNLSGNDIQAAQMILTNLTRLGESITNDESLRPIPDDGASDIWGFNAALKEIGPITWLASPWLYSECYMYRLIHTFFTLSTSPFWKKFDVFRVTKVESFTSSLTATVQLLQWHLTTIDEIDQKKTSCNNVVADENIEKALFEEHLQISLWGNATDLSLLTSFSIEDLQSRQSKESRVAAKGNVVVDDTDRVWDLLWASRQRRAGRVDIVLDNAGFELLTDLVLAAYLLKAGFAKQIVLHGKRMPWFVSDVGVQDLEDLLTGLTSLSSANNEDEKEAMRSAGKLWRELVDQKQIELRIHPFWTTHYSFTDLRAAAPDIFSDLAEAEIVIFKGDLNYRKLTQDGLWPRTTSFETALGDLSKPPGLRILVLRTCKADVCVGLAPGRADELERKTKGTWTQTGLYGVISYWDAKK
jgi:uncharacterized protein with ATP-grasp and redox domains